MEKVCIACLISKPIEDFYKHPRMADGHLGKCKECQKSAVLKNRSKKSDHYREYDRVRMRRKRAEDQEYLEATRKYDRERAKRPERIANAIEQTRKWRAEDSRRSKCHVAVAKALRNGSLVPKDCAVCGSEKSVAHHEDYDKPLDVIWLCQAHHKQLHAKRK